MLIVVCKYLCKVFGISAGVFLSVSTHGVWVNFSSSAPWGVAAGSVHSTKWDNKSGKQERCVPSERILKFLSIWLKLKKKTKSCLG